MEQDRLSRTTSSYPGPGWPGTLGSGRSTRGAGATGPILWFQSPFPEVLPKAVGVALLFQGFDLSGCPRWTRTGSVARRFPFGARGCTRRLYASPASRYLRLTSATRTCAWSPTTWILTSSLPLTAPSPDVLDAWAFRPVRVWRFRTHLK